MFIWLKDPEEEGSTAVMEVGESTAEAGGNPNLEARLTAEETGEGAIAVHLQEQHGMQEGQHKSYEALVRFNASNDPENPTWASPVAYREGDVDYFKDATDEQMTRLTMIMLKQTSDFLTSAQNHKEHVDTTVSVNISEQDLAENGTLLPRLKAAIESGEIKKEAFKNMKLEALEGVTECIGEETMGEKGMRMVKNLRELCEFTGCQVLLDDLPVAKGISLQRILDRMIEIPIEGVKIVHADAENEDFAHILDLVNKRGLNCVVVEAMREHHVAEHIRERVEKQLMTMPESIAQTMEMLTNGITESMKGDQYRDERLGIIMENMMNMKGKIDKKALMEMALERMNQIIEIGVAAGIKEDDMRAMTLVQSFVSHKSHNNKPKHVREVHANMVGVGNNNATLKKAA